MPYSVTTLKTAGFVFLRFDMMHTCTVIFHAGVFRVLDCMSGNTDSKGRKLTSASTRCKPGALVFLTGLRDTGS